MTDDMIALARRAVACKGWRWMPGMRTYGGFLLVAQHTRDGWLGVLPNDTSGVLFRVAPDATPDLTDPATLGCLRALVTEAYADPKKLWNGYVEVQRDSATLFFVMQFQHDADGFLQEIHRGTGRTEAEALVAALEAAPA